MSNKKVIDKLKQLPRNIIFPYYGGVMAEKDIDGDWVRWDGVEALIEELELEIKLCDK